ncbi:hypothetical protein ACS0TY_027607 [Phlomoides rotata]
MDRAFHPQIVLRLPSSTRIVTAVLYLHHRRLLRDTICPIGVSCATPSALSASRSLSSPSSIASSSLLLASNLSSSVYRCVAVLCHCVAILCRSHRHPLPLTSSSSAARVAVLHLPQASSRYIIVVENDLCVLDYLSDFICCLYGKPGAYEVVTLPFSVREGINIFLAGFDPTENLRFRDESLTFKVAETPRGEIGRYARYKYPSMSKTQGDFKLKVMEGELCESQITVLPEENGTGKTTFIRMLAGLLVENCKDSPSPFVLERPLIYI